MKFKEFAESQEFVESPERTSDVEEKSGFTSRLREKDIIGRRPVSEVRAKMFNILRSYGPKDIQDAEVTKLLNSRYGEALADALKAPAGDKEIKAAFEACFPSESRYNDALKKLSKQ